VIGDAPRDIEAGKAAGCRTILFTGPSLKQSPAALAEKKVEPDYVCSTLGEAMGLSSGIPSAPRRSPPPSRFGRRLKLRLKRRCNHRRHLRLPHRHRPTRGWRTLAEQMLGEMRRRHEQPVADFSVSKLLAGVVQVIVLFVLFLAFLNRNDEKSLTPTLIFALTLQTMTIALLIMGKQR
jgi:hypothetical protein